MGNGVFYRVDAGYFKHITCAGEQSRFFHIRRCSCCYPDQYMDDHHEYQKHDRISSSPSICSLYGRIIQRYVILPVDHSAKNDGFCYRFSCTADQSVIIHLCRRYFPHHSVLFGCFPDSKKAKGDSSSDKDAPGSCSGRRFCNKSCRFASFRVCRLFVDEYRLSAYGLFIFYDGVKFIHKYFFIKANQDIIRQHRI